MNGKVLYTRYPVAIVWRDYSIKDHAASWIQITTVVVDMDEFYTPGCDSFEVGIRDTFGFGSVAGDTSIYATFHTYLDFGADRAWKVTE